MKIKLRKKVTGAHVHLDVYMGEGGVMVFNGHLIFSKKEYFHFIKMARFGCHQLKALQLIREDEDGTIKED